MKVSNDAQSVPPWQRPPVACQVRDPPLAVRIPLVLPVTEAELLTEVLWLCGYCDVFAFHSGDSRRDRGKGFPDLVLAGKRSILFAELKSLSGRFSSEQMAWKYRLLACNGNWVWWTPEDLSSGLIEKTLVSL